jgi:hypothetical protein
MSLQRYSSDVLGFKSGTSYTVINTSDSVTTSNLEEFLAILHEVSHSYELIMNPNKHIILAVKKHLKITDGMDLR